MAVANRYTKFEPAVFSPMSLQDMMVVPLAQQKRHEQQVEAQDLLSQQANALMGLPGADSDAISAKIKEYQAGVQSAADQIGAEGVTREGLRKFKGLYKGFQSDTSPSGDVGRIVANYAGAKAGEKAFRESMQKQGHTLEYIDKKVADKYAGFQGTLGEDGAYNEFGEFTGSKFYDPKKETMELLSKAGASGVRVGSVGADVEYDEATGLFRINKNLTGIEQSNAENIKNGINSILSEYESGDKRQFLDDYGISQEKLKERVTSTAGVFAKSMDANPLEQVQFMNAPKAKTAQTGSGNGQYNNYVSGKIVDVTNVRRAEDQLDVLNQATHKNSNLNYRDTGERGFGRSTIKGDSRVGKPGLTEVSPSLLESIFLDEDFKKVPGSSNMSLTRDGKTYLVSQTGKGLMFEGGGYSTIIKDRGIQNIYGKYFETGGEGKASYLRDQTIRKQGSAILRGLPEFGGYTDEQMDQAYANAVASNTNIHSTAFNFSNRESSYYAEDDAVLGKKGDRNIGQIASRKVTATDEDGKTLLDFNSLEDLAEDLTGSTYKELVENNELNRFYDVIQTAQSYGIDTSQSGNPRVYSVTDLDGNNIILNVGSDSGATQRGMNDYSEMMGYLAKGQPFVNKGPSRNIDPKTNEEFTSYTYYIHYPEVQADKSIRLIPLKVNTKRKQDSLEGVLSLLDRTTLEPIDSDSTGSEGIEDVQRRTNETVEDYYSSIPQGKSSFTQVYKEQS